MFNVLCYKSKTLKNGVNPLVISVCKDGKKKYQSLGVSVNPIFWDFTKNQPKANCPKKQEILWNQIEETERKINAINRELSNKEDSILNLTDFLKYAVDLVYNPLEMWEKVELGDKKRFQNLLFPEGILFDKENRHIEPLTVNQFFIINHEFSMSCENEKTELSCKNTEKSRLVLGAGLEPAQPQWSQDFKSCVSTIPPSEHPLKERKSERRDSNPRP